MRGMCGVAWRGVAWRAAGGDARTAQGAAAAADEGRGEGERWTRGRTDGRMDGWMGWPVPRCGWLTGARGVIPRAGDECPPTA
eukprot:scaffold3068_cov401-Prasinococcus_capsulatus_cf.AAC.58